MAEVLVAEFPFVNGLPKREKSKLATMWDRLQELNDIVAQKGILLAPVVAAELVGVSRQRICELCDEGRLERVDVCGRSMVTEASVRAFAESERKTGRPLTKVDAFKATVRKGLQNRRSGKNKS